jgi:hypothetical protein
MGADREALVNTITSGNTFLKSGVCQCCGLLHHAVHAFITQLY